MISIDRLKEMVLEDIENNPEKHLEEYIELLQQLDQLKSANEQAEQKLKRIGKLCDGKTNKSSFCNGIENKDLQKLAIRILQIIDEGE